MKKKYRMPLAKVHELKCDKIMAVSGEQEKQSVGRVHFLEKNVDEWSD